MRVSRRALASAGLLFISTFCFSDYIELSRNAHFYSKPDRTSTVIKSLERGQELPLVPGSEQVNGYYNATDTASSQSGWVYRTFVRRYEGAIEASAETNPTAPTAALPEESSRHTAIGEPKAIYEFAREGYALAEDARLKIPLWVQYELRPTDLGGSAEREEASFHPDTAIPYGARSELTDYASSGYERGHMVPAEDMSRNAALMEDCFLLSNIAPQLGDGFNRSVWGSLEKAVRGWVEQKGALTIISGPVFKAEGKTMKYPVIGNDNVAVPTHFFKIIVDAKDISDVDALAFLLPHVDLKGKKYEDYLVSIDEIEKLTGLDFLSALPKEVQDRVESNKASRLW